MTNKEAIEKLKEILFMTGYKEALDLAIKALETSQGEWIRLDLAKRVIAKFEGYLDEDMIYRIQLALEKENDADIRKDGTDCMDEDAKQASIPYTYNAPQHDWKCGYPNITSGKGGAE